MDSSVGQLERLLKEGANFTFANFSIRDAAQGSQYGGADSPAWLTWKTRVFNTIHALLEEKSAPVALLKGAMDMSTRGNLEDRFVEQKPLMLAAVEQHTDLGFAFILLTADDVAYKADQETVADVDRKKEFRARLGRRRVCCLVKGEVARPSNIDGLVYKAIPEAIEGIG